MTISHAERRQIENEMIFRRGNEEVGEALDDLDAQHIEAGHFDLVRDENLELYFKCECSDENCDERIPVLLDEYQTIHEDRDTFIVLPNHQFDPIEKILKKTKTYNVVKKNNSTSEPAGELNTTDINN
jgi:hypothetical protein